MSLDKRIKRRIIGRRHDFFAVSQPGFETMSAKELAPLSETIEISGTVNGGVSFSGRLPDLYLASLHCRTAVRFLMRLARFKATNFQQLEKHVQTIPWELYLPAGDVPKFNVTAHHSRLYHSRAIAEHIGQCIAARWVEQGLPSARSKGQTLFVRLQDDEATLSLDCSGDPLYRRGLKTHSARAPLRETTAAGIFMLSGYRPGNPLLDPMCGSGTFSLEAAMITQKIPPGILRQFAFMQWPAFRPQQLAYMIKTANRNIRPADRTMIWASDSDGKTVDRMRNCIQQNELIDTVAVSRANFFDLRPASITPQKGMVVLNPPYGKRLSSKQETENRYQEIAAKLQTDFKGWQAALLVPGQGLANRLKLSLKPFHIRHGGLDLILLTGRI